MSDPSTPFLTWLNMAVLAPFRTLGCLATEGEQSGPLSITLTHQPGAIPLRNGRTTAPENQTALPSPFTLIHVWSPPSSPLGLYLRSSISWSISQPQSPEEPHPIPTRGTSEMEVSAGTCPTYPTFSPPTVPSNSTLG